MERKYFGGFVVPHIKDIHELRALALLQQVIDMSNQDRDALPGSVVKKVKDAAKILKKRQAAKRNNRSP